MIPNFFIIPNLFYFLGLSLCIIILYLVRLNKTCNLKDLIDKGKGDEINVNLYIQILFPILAIAVVSYIQKYDLTLFFVFSFLIFATQIFFLILLPIPYSKSIIKQNDNKFILTIKIFTILAVILLPLFIIIYSLYYINSKPYPELEIANNKKYYIEKINIKPFKDSFVSIFDSIKGSENAFAKKEEELNKTLAEIENYIELKNIEIKNKNNEVKNLELQIKTSNSIKTINLQQLKALDDYTTSKFRFDWLISFILGVFSSILGYYLINGINNLLKILNRKKTD
jgi:ABC-type uncharacterized transport system fused permease/ATPase subunit